MKITTPQITWHGGEAGKNDPVLSADVHPCGVLATGGADAEVRVSVRVEKMGGRREGVEGAKKAMLAAAMNQSGACIVKWLVHEREFKLSV